MSLTSEQICGTMAGMPLTKSEISQYMSSVARKNKGRPLSEKKRVAVLNNLAKGREKLANMSSTDRAKVIRRRVITRKARNGM